MTDSHSNTRQNFANSGSRPGGLLGEDVFPHLGKHLSNYSYVISKGKINVQATAKKRAIGGRLRTSESRQDLVISPPQAKIFSKAAI